jgi:hypothetical protein
MKTSISILITLVLAIGAYCKAADVPPPTPAEEQPEVLTRGPVNEAYAEPVNMENQTGVTAPIEPPAVIDEAPPSDRPSGDQFVWIPGYWAWDSERNGYIWVSGCWRAAPPSMYWVPGYWARTTDGWQWVAGFWSPSANTELEYLPAPPALTDADLAPPEVVPSPDRIWVPSCWYWRHSQYIRRPGYWVAAQQDWVWVPTHYVWTPRGYIFVGGHWDYSLRNRGVLFAPVYFPGHHYRGRFALSIVVDTGNFEFSLFTSPSYCHYYFGDYYDNLYIGIGIFPWYECERRHGWYDPIYFHDRWRHHRDEPHWYDHQREEYEHRRADRDLRPPRTYREMETRVARLPEAQRRNLEMARPMNVVVKSKSNMKFEQIKPAERQRIEKQATDVHKFVEDRGKWESQGRREGRQTVERVPEELRNERGTADRKGPEAKPQEKRETTAPAEQKGPEARPQDRREAPSPAERKGPEAKPQERKEAPSPAERKAPEVKPQEQGKERAPAQEERKTPESKPQERKAPEAKPEQKPSVSPSEGGQSEKVKVPNPPVVGRQGGMFRKGPPSQPSEEQKANEAPKEKSQPKSDNRDNRKDGDTSRDKKDRG